MVNKKCVFIGGKPIGNICLLELLKRNIAPTFVIPNLDDKGRYLVWHESLAKISRQNSLKVLSPNKLNDQKIIKKIKEAHPDIIFCIGSTRIIPPEIIKIPKLGCLNIHPGPLPKYRGRYSTAYSIFNGETYTGVTLHWIEKGIDSGPIIMQRTIRISSEDTARCLYEKFTAEGHKLFVKFLKIWLSGKKIVSIPQDDHLATYNPMVLPARGEINWSWNGKKIRDFIRAMTFEPFPPASFTLGEKRMVIVDEKYFNRFKNYEK
ncbi:MAG: formyltransferase family protein [Candidatus Omnitrophota bacterium]